MYIWIRIIKFWKTIASMIAFVLSIFLFGFLKGKSSNKIEQLKKENELRKKVAKSDRNRRAASDADINKRLSKYIRK